PKALQAPQAPEAPKTKPGRLLVRSVPSGANVTVDGVARGETPLALRDLDVGTRSVIIAPRRHVTGTRNGPNTQARRSTRSFARACFAEARRKRSGATEHPGHNR